MNQKTKEPQYQVCLELAESKPVARFGLMSNQAWHDDPKRLAFTLARYKFVAKMLSGLEQVLEVGCADGFGTRVVRQEVSQVAACDFDPVFIEDARSRLDPKWPIEFLVHDILAGPLPRRFDAVYALDVLEHIPAAQEERFLRHIVLSMREHGVCILGSPSLQSQAYASPPSREGHVNCKDASGWKSLMQRFFHNVFVFSMNDEVVHTGFYAMAHYLLALCCGPKLQ